MRAADTARTCARVQLTQRECTRTGVVRIRHSSRAHTSDTARVHTTADKARVHTHPTQLACTRQRTKLVCTHIRHSSRAHDRGQSSCAHASDTARVHTTADTSASQRRQRAGGASVHCGGVVRWTAPCPRNALDRTMSLAYVAVWCFTAQRGPLPCAHSCCGRSESSRSLPSLVGDAPAITRSAWSRLQRRSKSPPSHCVITDRLSP
jgi:hypothetical protein